MKINKKTMLYILLVISILFCLWYLKFAKHHPNNIDLKTEKPNYWAVTFSKKLCEEIHLDWKEVYRGILDDLNVRYIRIPIYWDDIEKVKGQYDFSDYDYIFDEGKKRGVKFVVNIGWRLPRWPECHAPNWAFSMGVADIKNQTLSMIDNVVSRYKDRDEIIMWQVENEPLLNTFGICPDGDETFLRREVKLVRELDKRPILITASGELSSWRREWDIGDVFGTTMYRVVWNPVFGYFRYPIPAWFYKFKASFLKLKPENMIISELQAEPWVPKGTLKDLKSNESNKSFDIEQFRANLQYAINSDLNQCYLWGVEWWYLQMQNGNSEYWNLAREIFRQ